MKELYICNLKDKKGESFSLHCTNQCKHGIPHEKDECTSVEFCNCHTTGNLVKVKCRKLKKKELKEF